MAKATPLIVSFNGGETSPRVDARSDISKYYTSCRTLENFIPLVEGAALRMPGTYFVIETKDSTKFSRLIPFHFSTTQAYVIEVGEEYFRFYKDEGQIVLAYAAWLTGQAYTIGLLRTNGGNYYRCLVAHTSGVFATDLAAGYWAVTGGASDLAYEIPTPYQEDDLSLLKFTQSADVLYIFHPSYPPKSLTRTAHTTWTLSDHVCKTGDEMEVTDVSNAATAVVTCTTVPTTLAAGDIVYISGVVGMTEVNNLYFTVGTVVTGAGGTFELSGVNSTAYTGYDSAGAAQEAIYGTDDNNPSCGTFYEQRLATGGTNNEPQTIHLSVTSDYADHTLDPTSDDAAIEITLASDRVDRVYWLMGFEFLVAGTTGGVWRIGATTSGEPVTQTNITAKKQVTLGCKNIEPEMVADSLLWVSRSGLSVNQFVYTLEKDKYIPLDMTRIAKHITIGDTAALSGITDMDFQKEPLPILWAIRADGQILGMTYETQEEVYGWFRIITDGEFESIAVISQDDEEDQVWVTVKRTIDGSDVRYIEYFKPIELYSQIEDAFFVHSGLTWDGGAASTVTAITNADPCVATVAAGHVLVTGDKIKFRFTGTWLDTHIVTAHLVAGNTVTIWNEADDTAIDATDTATFGIYTYPSTDETTTYTGTAQNIVHIEQSSPVRIFLPDHGIEVGTPIQIAGVLGMTEINGDHEVYQVSQDTITINLDATGYTAYTSAGTVTPGSTTTQDGTVEVVKKEFVSGLDHLEGELLAILIDGAVHPNTEVDTGTLTLNYYGNKIHVGLPYTSTLEPMKIHAGSQLGTARGKKQKISKVTICFNETVGGKVGPDSDNLKSIPFGTGGQPELYTGDIENIQFGGNWGKEATITIVQDQPLPMCVIGIVPHLDLNE